MRYGPIEATLDREQGANVWLTFGIREGKNREVRKVLETLGLKVNRLIRVAFGPFELGELDDGAVEEVKTEALRKQLGEKIVAAGRRGFRGAAGAIDDGASSVPHPSFRWREPQGRASRKPETRSQPPPEMTARALSARDRNDNKAIGGTRTSSKSIERRDRTGGPRPK